MNNNGLPKGWARSVLGVVCQKIQDGTHFSPDKEKQLPEGPYPYVTAKNVRPGGLDLSDLTFLAEEDHRQIYQRCDTREGDVLLVKDGVNTGDAAINTCEGEISLLSSVCMLRPHNAVLVNQFLRYYLQSPNGYRSLTGQMTGTAIKRIILRKIRDTEVPLAPLNEQRRIVAKIEELFSELDAGVAALERVRANLKRYRASVLQAAVTGKLTEAWRAKHRDVEPASELLRRILAERRRKWEQEQLAKFAAASKTPPKGWQSKYVEPTAPDTTGLPQLPAGWCWASVEQLGDVQLGRQRSPQNRSDKYPTKYIRAANITENGLALDDILDMDFSPTEKETYRLHPGDLVLSEASGSPDQVGKPAVWNGEIEDCCFQNTVIRLRPYQLSTSYTLTVLRHFYFNKLFARTAAGVGINHLSAAKFSMMPFPLAPLAEQDEISRDADRRLSILTATDALIETNLKRAARLRQSILKRAFEGKLVPQDPSDEPADKLLQRIRQQRAETNGSARRTRTKAKPSPEITE